ncbi:hypothetical protein CA54_03450 [Symmachiella macrocystis]|uniref:Uncharacterized protein n=1 Tax=Symmachiella macrocystis TaxID=2527985 RepID=A0A5C6BHK6_9PLAN|nr:hypothetical protein CA54_03450 [Symmachiella macrocystis]
MRLHYGFTTLQPDARCETIFVRVHQNSYKARRADDD